MTLISRLMSFLMCRQWSPMPNGRVCMDTHVGASCLRVTLHADGLCMIHLCLHLYARAALARLLTCHDPISRDSCVSTCVITVLIWMRVYTFGLFLLKTEGTVYPEMKILSSFPLMLFQIYMLLLFHCKSKWGIFQESLLSSFWVVFHPELNWEWLQFSF